MRNKTFTLRRICEMQRTLLSSSVRKLLWIVVPLLSVATVTLADPPAASPTAEVELSKPIYTPPKHLIPRARVGGQMRGTEGTDPEVQALVPDHVGLTTHRTPVLNWFLSKPTTNEVRFTLIDNRVIKPIHEAPLPAITKAGIYKIDLKELGVELDPEVQYRWYISVIRNPDSPSQDIVAGGVIERCELSECLSVMDARLGCNQQGVVANARAGFWYDAMGCLCNMIDENPTDAKLRRLRAALLKQVGLNGVAEWDLRSIQSPLP